MRRQRSSPGGHGLLGPATAMLMLLLALGVTGLTALLAQRASSTTQGRGSLQLNAAYGLHRLVLDVEQSAWASLCTHVTSTPYAVAFTSCTRAPESPAEPFGMPVLSPTTGCPVWQAQHVYYAFRGTLLFRRVALPEPFREVPRRLTQAQLASYCDGSGTPVAHGVSRLDAAAADAIQRTVLLGVTTREDARTTPPVVIQARASLFR